MKNDLDRIKKLYGEDFAKQFCRKHFSHIIEREDFSFADFLIKLIAPNRYFYEDLIKHNKLEDFKNSIWGMFNEEITETSSTNETPEQLMKRAGYTLYKCETKEDIERFRKYYALNEELCTFEDDQRINTHTIFWAVKDGAQKLKRHEFLNPKRQDEYGTSVLSIQFSKGFESTLAIINRYNSAVKYAEATFSNNLDKIYPGLTSSFKKHYDINLISGRKAFKIPGYIFDENGTYHKLNNQINGVCYCADNVIIKNGKSTHYDPTRYILADYYIIDRKEKTIELFNESGISDAFVEQFNNIRKIDSTISDDKKYVKVWCDDGVVEIILNKYNQIIKFTNNNVKEIGNGFMQYCTAIEDVVLEQVEEIGDDCLTDNKRLKHFITPNLISIGNSALCYNEGIEELRLQNAKSIGNFCFISNKKLTKFLAPKLESVGKSFMCQNNKLKNVRLPQLRKIDFGFMSSNDCATKFTAPLLDMNIYKVYLNNTFQELKKDTIISKMLQTMSKFRSNEDVWDLF